MTSDPFEREAERIADLFAIHPVHRKEMAYRVAKALEAAYQKGLEAQPKSGIRRTVAFAEGFEAAREAAAKVVRDTPSNTYSSDCDHDELANEILSLQPSEKTGE